jgi:hypothetical protein
MSMRLKKSDEYEFHCALYSLRSFWQYAEFASVLTVLEGVAVPEYFGEDDIVHSDYDRSEIARWFKQTDDPSEGRPPFVLKRAAVPRYSMSVNVGNAVHPHSIHLSSTLRHEAGELEKLFELADALADDADLDFGSVNLYREGSAAESDLGEGGEFEDLGDYIANGPKLVWVRTFFGLRLITLAGSAAAFTGAGGSWRRLTSGVLALDLDARPWERTPEELRAAQLTIAPNLRARTGIFAVPDGNAFGDDVPGPRWQPPAGALWPA